MGIKGTLIIVTATIALILTGCTTTGLHLDPVVPAIDIALDLCISAHPATSEYADPDGEGHVQQTAAEACARWLTKVGEEEFVDQWDEEYADTYRKAFAS